MWKSGSGGAPRGFRRAARRGRGAALRAAEGRAVGRGGGAPAAPSRRSARGLDRAGAARGAGGAAREAARRALGAPELRGQGKCSDKRKTRGGLVLELLAPAGGGAAPGREAAARGQRAGLSSSAPGLLTICTLLACGPLSPSSALKRTSVPTASRSKSSCSTLLRWK